MKPAAAWKALKKHAARKPGAWEDHPWGETVYKVGKKVFVFLGMDDGGLALSCKLQHSSEAAITMFSFAAPTAYGLGKAGWVSARRSPMSAQPSSWDRIRARWPPPSRIRSSSPVRSRM